MPKIGKALKRAVELKPLDEADDGSRKVPASPLMNLNRRKIFQFLCMHPCSRIEAISSHVSLSRSSASWHLGCLIDTGFVHIFLDSKTKRYYPAGLIPSKNLRIYSVLGEDGCRAVYRAVLASPGADRSLLVDNLGASGLTGCLNNLLEISFITRVKDGKHARFFPTERCLEVQKEERAAGKDFIRLLIRKMTEEHLKPELMELKGSNPVIEMKILSQKEKLEIPQRILSTLMLE
jgi:DNA-binding transcriptional ArsR family regulator